MVFLNGFNANSVNFQKLSHPFGVWTRLDRKGIVGIGWQSSSSRSPVRFVELPPRRPFVACRVVSPRLARVRSSVVNHGTVAHADFLCSDLPIIWFRRAAPSPRYVVICLGLLRVSVASRWPRPSQSVLRSSCVRHHQLVRPYRATPITLVVPTVRAVFRVLCVGCVRSWSGPGVRLVVVVSLV